MTWREKCVVSILLLVARIVSDNADHAEAIRHLANHISVHAASPSRDDE